MPAVHTAFDFSRAAAVRELAPSAQAPCSAVAQARSASSSSPLQRQRALADALEADLRLRAATTLRLTITDNRRTMLSLKRDPCGIEVRLHHMFLEADASTRSALASYLFEADRSAAQHIGRYIEQHRTRIRAAVPRRARALSSGGAHHDLAEIYRTVNQRYFEGSVDARISWGRDAQCARARRSIKLGSYTASERLIRVHPALDAGFVPRFFVEYIVYHEMLHHVLPPKLTHGRRELHGPAFQARERLFLQYAEALRWERENLGRLLRRQRHATRKAEH